MDINIDVFNSRYITGDVTSCPVLISGIKHNFLSRQACAERKTIVIIDGSFSRLNLLLDAARADGRDRHIDWGTVERLRPFGGIRIEDDVACTAGAPENLTRDAFAALG